MRNPSHTPQWVMSLSHGQWWDLRSKLTVSCLWEVGDSPFLRPDFPTREQGPRQPPFSVPPQNLKCKQPLLLALGYHLLRHTYTAVYLSEPQQAHLHNEGNNRV